MEMSINTTSAEASQGLLREVMQSMLLHNVKMPMQYAGILRYDIYYYYFVNDNVDGKRKIFFLMFAQNTDNWYILEPPLISTHNQCFRAKIRK